MATEAQGFRDGSAFVAVADVPTAYRTIVEPTITGTPTPVVAINGGASAGSRHIDDSSPTLAETLTEQIVWTFSSDDEVREVLVTLAAPPGYGYNGTNLITNEAAWLKVVVNPGDDVNAATWLLAGTPEVMVILPGQTLSIWSESSITKVYAIAKLSANANVIQAGASAVCHGVSHAE